MSKQICLVGAALALVVVTNQSPAAVEHITNGHFEAAFNPAGVSNPVLDLAQDSLPAGWNRVETFTGLNPLPPPIGNPEISRIALFNGNGPSAAGQQATIFVRNENPQNMSGDWTAIEQPLNVNVAGYCALNLSMDLMIIWHDLEAGGFVNPAFEWPAVVQIDYLDTAGNAQIWRYGWYLVPPGDVGQGPANDPGQGLIPVYNDVLVPQGVWVASNFNLLNELPQAQTIRNIRVGGSGWSYESVIDNVSIQGTLVPEPSALVLGALALAGLLYAGLRGRRRGA